MGRNPLLLEKGGCSNYRSILKLESLLQKSEGWVIYRREFPILEESYQVNSEGGHPPYAAYRSRSSESIPADRRQQF
jgi:hypothetical protein